MTSNYDYQGFSYDIQSIMHYGSYSFTSNGLATIVAKSGATLLDAYQKTDLTSTDIKSIKKAYNGKNML